MRGLRQSDNVMPFSFVLTHVHAHKRKWKLTQQTAECRKLQAYSVLLKTWPWVAWERDGLRYSVHTLALDKTLNMYVLYTEGLRACLLLFSCIVFNTVFSWVRLPWLFVWKRCNTIQRELCNLSNQQQLWQINRRGSVAKWCHVTAGVFFFVCFCWALNIVLVLLLSKCFIIHHLCAEY